jgi:hypothetical protein
LSGGRPMSGADADTRAQRRETGALRVGPPRALAPGMSTYEMIHHRHRLARRELPFFLASVAVVASALLQLLV